MPRILKFWAHMMTSGTMWDHGWRSLWIQWRCWSHLLMSCKELFKCRMILVRAHSDIMITGCKSKLMRFLCCLGTGICNIAWLKNLRPHFWKPKVARVLACPSRDLNLRYKLRHNRRSKFDMCWRDNLMSQWSWRSWNTLDLRLWERSQYYHKELISLGVLNQLAAIFLSTTKEFMWQSNHQYLLFLLHHRLLHQKYTYNKIFQ